MTPYQMNDTILGFQLFRADRDTESTGKSRGGGTCFYINEKWCSDVTVLKKMCCPDLETLFVNCKPFFSGVLLVHSRTVKRWTNETERDLQACFDLTDWSVFEAAANDMDELSETVTSYISFCEDVCIPIRTHLTYNNDKPWFTAKLRQLRQAKEEAYRKGDKSIV